MTSLIGFRDEPFRAAQAGKKLHLSNISRIGQETQRVFREGELIKPADLNTRIRDQAVYCVQFNGFREILPLSGNRVVSSATEVDAIGIPHPEITYYVDDYIRRSAVHTREVYTTATQVVGGTNVGFHDGLASNNHITGATVVGADPKDSVADKDCRAFNHPDLFISNSSTMPIVSTVNMTLTIAALALRVADQLEREA